MKRKLLSMALAMAMALSLNATVFAEPTNGGDGTTDMDEVHIQKVYKLEGAGSSPAETFTVSQVGNGEVTDGDAVNPAPALGKITGAVYAKGDASAEGVTKDIVIQLPTYDTVGKYEYTLAETKTGTAGVIYAENMIRLVVTVINGEDGKARIGAIHTEDVDSNVKTDTIENTYTANSLSVTKNVAGNLGDKTKEFQFTVEFTNPENNGTWTNEIEIAEGSGATGMKPADNKYTFTLSDNDTVTFTNIPAGVQYTVSESDYTADGYKTTVGEDKINTVTGTMDSQPKSVTFTNTKTTDVETGITLDSLPYILALGFVVLCAVALIIRKRFAANR